MEDCCAVCAETLEWIAYGSCGHRELCSTCVVRLRFILGDRHCCICKTDCPTIFVTKALGNFTEAKSDFSEFPPGVSEGQHGKYWYHEDSQAYFNDVDHYRMIRAMCRLSCTICDNNAPDEWRDGNRRNKFRNIEQLKGHLYHQHRMFMCSLCLESRKVFISEQKLYNRSQLRQHISSGDSEADGNESERGGFAGHPICEFCRNPFYGDTELYMHMSTEHYTCHICQRQHPGQYDYYRNYDDLEAHFRQEHFLCEHEACLAKKFVVFQSEAEMKRHNTIEHSGLSRSKRNAALQIPVSFRYRRSVEEDQQRGRRRRFHREPSQLSIQGSSEMAVADGSLHESSSGSGRIHSDRGETNQSDMITSTMESLAISSHPEELSSMMDANNSQSFGSAPAVEEISFPPLSNFELPEPSSRYAQVLNQGISARLVEASFPPLPGAKDSIKPMIAPASEGLAANTIAARLKLRSKVLHSARPKASQDYEHGYSISGSSLEMRPQARSHSPATSNSNFITGVTANQIFPPVSSASPQVPTLRGNGFATSIPISSVWNSHSLNRARHSASAPNLSINGPPNNPPSSIISSVTLNGELSPSNESLQHVQNVQIANKSLVESIRSGLGMDEEKYSAFKTISTEYRQDRIDTWEYLSYVEQFGLSHLVLELARLCPDSKKQQELIDAYNANVCHIGVQENNSAGTARTHKVGKRRKGKGKAVEAAAKDALADNNLDNSRELQTSDHSFKEVEVLSKDGYYTAKDQLSSTREHNTTGSMIVDDSSSQRKTITDNSGGECGRKNHHKLKFHRLPLGEGNADRNPRTITGEHSTDSDRVPVRGVWHNGGGHRLFSQSYASK